VVGVGDILQFVKTAGVGLLNLIAQVELLRVARLVKLFDDLG